MSDIDLERRFLTGLAEDEDALISDAALGNPAPAANVVREMVHQLAEDAAMVESDDIREARKSAIYDLAGKLLVLPALEELYARPIASEYAPRVLSSEEENEVSRAQVAIIELFDSVQQLR